MFECLLVLLADLGTRNKELMVGRRSPIFIQAKNDAAQMIVVRIRSSELIIVNAIGECPKLHILKIAASAMVANQDVDLAIGPNRDRSPL